MATPVEQQRSGDQRDKSASTETRAATESSLQTKSAPFRSDDVTAMERGAPALDDRVDSTQESKVDVPERPEEQRVPVADLSKPGPKPLETLAKQYGGDAGKAGKQDIPTAVAGENANPCTDTGEEGSGEKHVKSTGFAAEGGDFDAAAAGAGREADRKSAMHVVPIHHR